MPKFDVYITRRVTEMVGYEVEADNTEDAEEMALAWAKENPHKFYFYDLDEDDLEIHDVQRLEEAGPRT